jgi:hypothetical protein
MNAVARTRNTWITLFLAAISVSLVGLSLMEEKGSPDDLLIILFGLVLVIWYFAARSGRETYSVWPVILVVFAFLAQLFGFITEIHDSGDFGDDVGIMPVLTILLVAVVWTHFAGRRSTT